MRPELVTNMPDTRLLGHPDAGPLSAAPPYHVRTVDFMFVLTEFDQDAARAALPPSLELQQNEPGFMGLYSAPVGWGIAPYSAFFVAVPVRGHDSPDGSCGYLMAEGYYSGRAGPVMHEAYNRRLVPGTMRHWDDGRVWYGEAGPGTTPAVQVRVRPVLPRPATPLVSGVHHYLGERADGGLNIYSVAYSTVFFPVEEVSVDFTKDASPLLQTLRPLSFPYASLSPSSSLTFSAPSLVQPSGKDTGARSAQVALIDMLSRLGLPAALVTSGGRVLFMSAEAKAMVQQDLLPGQVWAPKGARLRPLGRAIAAAGHDPLPSKPLVVDTADRSRPVLAQVVPISASLAGEPAALVLLADAGGPARTDPVPTLTLLGLTPAEARIAAQVGGGLSARQAAEVLSLSENTVRSSLQLIYDKLGIAKQSELARIIARLEGFGPRQRPAVQGVL
ncbi:MAG: LuxR C-terminal-related transcriptional regulator [Paracoccaceae bacterium]